jgi:hypothetical protein
MAQGPNLVHSYFYMDDELGMVFIFFNGWKKSE